MNKLKSRVKAKPFVKWVGGKRQLMPEILKLLPSEFNTYLEPFTGGGALFFELNPKNAILNDKNLDLVDTYITIRDEPELLIKELGKHNTRNTKEYFLVIRKWDRTSRYYSRKARIRAARFIYMNKVCFNGMYRVNSSGEFNVPYGKYVKPNIQDSKNILNASEVLKNIKIFNADFAEIGHMAKKGDFIYLDPPYVPLSPTESFTSYTKDGFGLNEQLRLKNLFDELTEKGIKAMISNSSAKWVIEIYKNYNITMVTAKRSINSNGKRRSGCKEVIITNY